MKKLSSTVKGYKIHFIVLGLAVLTVGIVYLKYGQNQPVNAQASTVKTINIYPSADTFTEAAKPTTNYGTSQWLITSKSPFKTAYLKFDIPAEVVNAKIISTNLLITSVDNSQTNGEIVYLADSSDWQESNTTYTNRPALQTATAIYFTTFANKRSQIDVKSQLVSQLTSPVKTRITFGIGNNVINTSVSFKSRESNATPLLSVTYELSNITPTVTLTPSPTPLLPPKLSCTQLTIPVTTDITGTPQVYPATASTVEYSMIGPYRGAGTTLNESSDGGRAVWIDQNDPQIIYAGEWGLVSPGLEKSIDGGKTWKTVISTSTYKSIGVARDFFQVGKRVYLVSDYALSYEENNIWYRCARPDNITTLQTGRSLRDGTIIVGGMDGIATANSAHAWQAATGIPSGPQGIMMTRTLMEDPISNRIYAGGWFGLTVDYKTYPNPGLLVSDDNGVTFKRHEQADSLKGTTGVDPAINSIYATVYGGKRIIVAGTEASGINGQKGIPEAPSLFISVNDGPFSSITANSSGWNTAVGAGLVTPARGIFQTKEYLVVGSYCNNFAVVPFTQIINGETLQWKRITPNTPDKFYSGLSALSGDTLVTGGQIWGTTVPGFQQLKLIRNLETQINTVYSQPSVSVSVTPVTLTQAVKKSPTLYTPTPTPTNVKINTLK